MSNRRFLEIYSSRRDRNRFPLISQFDVPIEQTGLRNTSQTALDPVINAFPSYEFKLNTLSTEGSPVPFKFTGGTRFNPVLDVNSADSQNNNFYNGYHITDVSIVPHETRVILTYDGKNNTCTLDAPFSINWNIGDTYVLKDPSIPLNTIVKGTLGGNNVNPILTFSSVEPVPNYPLASFPDGYFNGYYLQITDLNGIVVEERIINDFVNQGAGNYLIFLNGNFTPDNFALASSFFINVTNFTKISFQPISTYATPNPANVNEYFTNDILYFEKTGEFKKIKAYDLISKIATLEDGFSTFNPITDRNAIFTIRKDIPIARGFFPNNLNNRSTLLLDPTTSPFANGVWDGKYIFIKPLGKGLNDVPNITSVYRIQNYYGANPPAGQKKFSVQINGGIYGIPIPIKNQGYEILNFSYDNFSPFCYNGSTVSQNQETCYEITLMSLILPNVTLKSGSRVSFYPYVYVELSTLGSANNNANQTIYSNNPKSGKALFIATITNYNDPNLREFVRLDSNDMTQTVKFKPNDNLKFSVFLPNGELFSPIIPDSFSPLPPKEDLQLEAVFSIKRLT